MTPEHRVALSNALKMSDAVKVAGARRSKSMRDFYASDEGVALRTRMSKERRDYMGSDAGRVTSEKRAASMRRFWSSDEGLKTKARVSTAVRRWARSDEGRRSHARRGKLMARFYSTPEGREAIKRMAKKVAESNRLDFDELSRRLEVVAANETIHIVPPIVEENYAGILETVVVHCDRCARDDVRRLNSLLLAPRCMLCDRQVIVSAAQGELATFIGSLGHDDVVVSDWTVVPPYELDVVVPSAKLAVEYHGLYWHSEANADDRGRTMLKRRLAEEGGYRVLTFFEDEWRDKRPIVEAMIRYRLGRIDRRLFARKCDIVDVSVADRRVFFDENHIAGDIRAKYAYGLVSDGELVAAMSLRTPLTKAYGRRYDVARFAVKRDTAVVGGVSKLTKHALARAAVDGRVGLLTYADMRFSSGDGYVVGGFQLVKETGPRFWWTDFVERRDRFSVRADGGLSEAEIARQQRVCRIYGDTNRVYVLDV